MAFIYLFINECIHSFIFLAKATPSSLKNNVMKKIMTHLLIMKLAWSISQVCWLLVCIHSFSEASHIEFSGREKGALLAILPSSLYAQVNPLFRLLRLHLCSPAGMPPRHKLREEKQICIPSSGDLQNWNCNCGDKCAETCRAPPTHPTVVRMVTKFLFFHFLACKVKKSYQDTWN